MILFWRPNELLVKMLTNMTINLKTFHLKIIRYYNLFVCKSMAQDMEHTLQEYRIASLLLVRKIISWWYRKYEGFWANLIYQHFCLCTTYAAFYRRQLPIKPCLVCIKHRTINIAIYEVILSTKCNDKLSY